MRRQRRPLGIGAGTAGTAAKVEPNRLLTAGHRNATGICRPRHLIQFQSTPIVTDLNIYKFFK